MYDDDILWKTPAQQGLARSNGAPVFRRLIDAFRLIPGDLPAATPWLS
jgi:hypothetical protein